VKARKVSCGHCGELRAVRRDGRLREHQGFAGARCAGGGRAAAIAVADAEPGDAVEFATGRQVRVAAVSVSRPAADDAAYVTIRHDAAGVPAGSPVPVLTVCFVDTIVRLAGTSTAVMPTLPAGGVAA